VKIRPLAINCFLHSCGKREKVKGERENTKPFPLSPSPFPDFCKKSIVERGVTTGKFRKLDPLQSGINIMGTCLFYFIGIGNAQHYPEDKGILSAVML